MMKLSMDQRLLQNVITSICVWQPTHSLKDHLQYLSIALQCNRSHDQDRASKCHQILWLQSDQLDNHRRTKRDTMVKERIKDLCYKEARKNIKAQNLSEREAMTDDRKIYREPYLIMYNTFDRYMRTELLKFNMTLEDIGLGYAKNVANKPYIDRITEAGQLNNLLVVAEALFQPKTNN